MSRRVIRGLVGMMLAVILGLIAYFAASAFGLDVRAPFVHFTALILIVLGTVGLTRLIFGSVSGSSAKTSSPKTDA